MAGRMDLGTRPHAVNWHVACGSSGIPPRCGTGWHTAKLSMPHGPLQPDERSALMAKARPRTLPIAPRAALPRRHLPLADQVRPADAVRPIYAVWEITLACDLACRHCGSRAGRSR